MSKRLQARLKARAASWAGQLTKLAKAFAPAHVEPAISSRVEAKDNGTFLIRITANRYMPLSPRNTVPNDTRAQEFGSGVHARRGPKRKYPIYPKTKKLLAFEWDVVGVGFNYLPDGRVTFKKVMHPGIEAANNGKGYIGPAMKELRKRAKAELTQDVKAAILGDLRESFGRK